VGIVTLKDLLNFISLKVELEEYRTKAFSSEFGLNPSSGPIFDNLADPKTYPLMRKNYRDDPDLFPVIRQKSRYPCFKL
jgi:hypothetical protein